MATDRFESQETQDDIAELEWRPLQGSIVTYNVDISNNDASNRYAVPCDGYIVCTAATGLARAGSFNGYMSITANQNVTTNSTFVKKGTLIQCTVSGDGKVYFRA